MADVRKHFLTKLEPHFTQTPGAYGTEENFFADLCDTLKYYSPDTLEAAARSIIREVKFTHSWPGPALCREHCERVVKNTGAPKPGANRAFERDQRISRYDVFRILGKHPAVIQAACKGGWHGHLFKFVQDKARMPGASEQSALIEESRELQTRLNRTSDVTEPDAGDDWNAIGGSLDYPKYRKMIERKREALKLRMLNLSETGEAQP